LKTGFQVWTTGGVIPHLSDACLHLTLCPYCRLDRQTLAKSAIKETAILQVQSEVWILRAKPPANRKTFSRSAGGGWGN